MMKLNHNAMAILTKHAYISFKAQKESAKHRFGIVQLSSSGSEFTLPQLSVYTATKRFNHVFAKIMNDTITKNCSKDGKIDTLIVKPGGVTTPMTNNVEMKGVTSTP